MNTKIEFNRKKQIQVFIMFAFAAIMCLLAFNGYADDNTAVDTLVNKFTEMLSTAGTVVGAIIAVWGIFQAIMAMRREDSEGISKQIITVVVGGLLIGFAQGAKGIINILMQNNGGGNQGGASNNG